MSPREGTQPTTHAQSPFLGLIDGFFATSRPHVPIRSKSGWYSDRRRCGRVIGSPERTVFIENKPATMAASLFSVGIRVLPSLLRDPDPQQAHRDRQQRSPDRKNGRSAWKPSECVENIRFAGECGLVRRRNQLVIMVAGCFREKNMKSLVPNGCFPMSHADLRVLQTRRARYRGDRIRHHGILTGI